MPAEQGRRTRPASANLQVFGVDVQDDERIGDVARRAGGEWEGLARRAARVMLYPWDGYVRCVLLRGFQK